MSQKKPHSEQLLSGALENGSFSKVSWPGEDLSGAKLAGADLSKSRLRKVNLAGADLAGANLSKADLRQANLTGVNLTGANLERAELDGADLSGARLNGANLDSVKIRDVNLDGVDASRSKWIGALASKSHGDGCRFTEADLTSSDFVEARFANADFTRTTLTQAIWINAEITDSRFDQVVAPEADFFLVQATNTSFREIGLSKANFSSARLKQVSFNKANLEAAQFTGGRLEDVDFDGAELKGCVLKGVKGFDEAAIVDFRTRGAKTTSLLWLRIIRTLKTNRWAQLAAAILIAAILGNGWLWFRNPENWTYARLDQAAVEAVGQQDPESALRFYNLILKKYSDDVMRVVTVRAQMAGIYLNLGDVDSARDQYNDVIAQAQDRPELKATLFSAELGLTDVLAKENRYDEAVASLKEFAKRWEAYPESVRAWERIGDIEANRSNWEAAEEACQTIIDGDNFNSDDVFDAQIRLARVYRISGNSENAIAQLEKLLQANADLPQRAAEISVTLVQYLTEIGEYNKADEVLTNLKTRYPDQIAAVERAESDVIDSLRTSGQSDEALARFRQILENATDPQRVAHIACSVAEILAQTGQYDEALKELEAVEERVKRDEEAAYQVGMERASVLQNAGRTDDAIEALKKVQSDSPDEDAALNTSMTLASLYRNARRYKDAEALLASMAGKSVELPHRRANILQAQGDLAADQGDLDRAIEFYEMAIKANDDLDNAFNIESCIFNIYRQKGDLDAWRRRIDSMMERYAQKPKLVSRTQLALADWYIAAGKTDEAESLLKKLSDDDDPSSARSALQMLATFYNNAKREKDLGAVLAEMDSRYPDQKDTVLQGRNSRAQMLMHEGKFEEAIAESVPGRDSADPFTAVAAWQTTMASQLKLGREDDALVSFKKGAEIARRNESALIGLISVLSGYYVENDRQSDAIQFLTGWLKDDSVTGETKAALSNDLANLYLRNNNYDTAIKILTDTLNQNAEQLRPATKSMILISRGQIRENMSERDAALKDYEAAAAISADSNQGINALIAQVRVATQLGQDAAVETLLTDYQSKHPNDPHALLALRVARADAQIQSGRTKPAIESLKSLAETATGQDAQMVLRSLANAYTSSQDWAAATAILERVLSELAPGAPERESYRQQLAWTMRSGGRLDEALKIYQQAVAETKDPGLRRTALNEWIGILAQKGDPKAAEELAASIADRFPDDISSQSEAANSVARIYDQLGNDERAVQWFEKALTLSASPEADVNTLQRLVAIFDRSQREAEAWSLLQKVEKRYPNSRHYRREWRLLAVDPLVRMSRLDDAKKLFDDAAGMTEDPEQQGQLYLHMAQTLRDAGREDMAMQYLQEAEKLSPDGGSASQALQAQADLLRRDRKFDEALAIYKKLAESSRTTQSVVWALQSMAQCLNDLGRPDDATAIYEKAMAKAKDDPELTGQVLSSLANQYRNMGRPDEAVKTLERAIQGMTNPERRANAASEIARIDVDRNRFDQALQRYDSILKELPENAQSRPDILMGRAYCLRRLGKTDEAIAAYGQAQKAATGPENAVSAQRGAAAALADAGRLDEAMKAYRSLAQSTSDPEMKAQIYGELANTLNQAGRTADSDAAYEDCAKAAPRSETSSNCAQNRAQSLVNQNRLDEAEKAFKSFLTENSSPRARYSACFGLADIARRQNKSAEELKYYQDAYKAADQPDSRANAVGAIAQNRLAAGKPDEAKAVFEKEIRITGSPPDVVARLKLGLARVKRGAGQSAEALADALAVAETYKGRPSGADGLLLAIEIALEKDDIAAAAKRMGRIDEEYGQDLQLRVNARQMLVQYYLSDHRNEEALKILDEVLAMSADIDRRRWATSEKSRAYADMKKYNEALAELKKISDNTAYQLDTRLEAQVSAARILRDSGQEKAAIETLWKVAKENPNSRQSLSALFELVQLDNQADGEQQGAIFEAIMKSPVANEQDVISAHSGLGDFDARHGRIAEAVKNYEWIYEKYPKRPESGWAMTSAARLLRDHGDQSRAVHLLETVVKDYKDDQELVKSAQALLDEIYKR